MSDGRIKVEMLPVGSIVEYNETLDAVGAGILSGHITDSSYFTGKDPAFALIGNPVGAYSSPEELRAFFHEGGGKELYNEILNPYGVQFIGPAAQTPESVPSKVPIDSVEDLQGVKIRAPEGMVQSAFAAAGRVAGQPAAVGGLHLARQGRDQRGRRDDARHQPLDGPARRRQAPDLSGLPLAAAQRGLDQQGDLGRDVRGGPADPDRTRSTGTPRSWRRGSAPATRRWPRS